MNVKVNESVTILRPVGADVPAARI